MTKPARWKVIAYATALFLAGALSGVMVTYHKPETQPLKVDRQGEIADHIRQRLKTTLALTPEQAQKVDPAIQKTAAELETIHRDCLDRISASLDQMHVQIAPELSADQKEKLKQMTVERREVMRKKYNYSPGPANPTAH